MTVSESLSTTENFNATAEKLTSQIVALESKVMFPQDESDKLILEVVAEKQKKLSYLLQNKEWNFNFEGGGWNSVYAVHREEAIFKAEAKYNETEQRYHSEENGGGAIPLTKVNASSVRLATPKDTANLLSMFY